jgi:uncharacterized membrane-anchored protein YhcB (DUF1043 family)
MAFDLIFLAVIFLVGVLVGGTLSERLLNARTRQQAALQRLLNSQQQELASQWRELEATRQEIAERGEDEPWQSVRH